MKTVYWQEGVLYLLDQTALPGTVRYQACREAEEVAQAIRDLVVRGAPLIGVTAAYGVALAAWGFDGPEPDFDRRMQEVFDLLASTRPTAVNLFWALNRMKKVYTEHRAQGREQVAVALLQEAEEMFAEDVATNQAMGDFGEKLFAPRVTLLTVCNAGSLATCGYGTALGVIRSCHREGKLAMVYACETRPVLQGARLTVWELCQDGIPVTLITDNMAGTLMQQSKVDGVVVGADRIAANGDTANKIGTYMLAVLAHYHGLPFYVAAPMSTIDFSLSSGKEIPIENRDPDEVRKVMGTPITVPDVPVFNPAFDVTPNRLISGIITEKGVALPPFDSSLAALRG
ncbi:MAG: S-methyl-5-thioribose-1-phosphate isomerase [Syntrophothermus sp.]|uniref:S-methyl-5-thioribose-1-phosphate isomerase n=1 Tax=Syntrophothermus sp. TaxID=2736299 RepID=UPI00257A98E5|nr:S-methyl-5-thioribose-1-phosphate isomerase [Syntrophothermus sp.]NSW82488.1 S-methyl-5-thioribose-1-phosphate isomerase [Syntrophothermus sp.]